jgi:hypothetical protein
MGVLIGLVVPSVAGAQAGTSKEYRVKAAFLFQFMQFIEWPESDRGDAGRPLCIGVLGQDPFGPALEEVTRNETVQNRPIEVRRSQDPQEFLGCQLVFIGRSERARADQALSVLSGGPVVTVGEVDGFARRGGIINFFLEGPRVRFEINALGAKQAGLKIRSQLLGLGRIVESEPAKGGN